ncbi:unnamed protein product [Symbiodinium sp. CCMP2456]|nr:unnamed protein product [Symbiodinium sp. CCMP2456]
MLAHDMREKVHGEIELPGKDAAEFEELNMETKVRECIQELLASSERDWKECYGTYALLQTIVECTMRFLGTSGAGVGTGVNYMGPLPSNKGFIGNPADNVMPTAMLDHIRLYRRVQLNWQAYDAYARVSLFCGANSLLYSCLYWALGSFLGGQHAGVAAICVALVFATIQAGICVCLLCDPA